MMMLTKRWQFQISLQFFHSSLHPHQNRHKLILHMNIREHVDYVVSSSSRTTLAEVRIVLATTTTTGCWLVNFLRQSNLCWSPYIGILHQRLSVVHRRHLSTGSVRRGRHRSHVVLGGSARCTRGWLFSRCDVRMVACYTNAMDREIKERGKEKKNWRCVQIQLCNKVNGIHISHMKSRH